MNSTNPSNPINLLTVDLEDYFQVHAFSNVIRCEDWGDYESRIEHNTHRLLEILRESGIAQSAERIANELTPNDSRLTPHASAKATFFVLGWIAERYPHLIKEIKDHDHEIACHGYGHQLIYYQSEEEFREDIRKAKIILEDIIGEEVIGYRAPSYSITNKSQWAFEVLMEEGFKYDSSIFPIHHDFYGFPSAPRFPFLISMNGNNNFEFSTLNFALQEPQSPVLDTSNYGPRNSVLSPSHSVPSPDDSVLNSESATNSSNPMNSINSTNPSNSSTQSSVLIAHNLKQQHSNTAARQHVFAPNGSLIEFPLSTVRFGGVNIPISGGGYFRLFPYSVVKKGLERINRVEGMPFTFYLHPWELDPDQPRLNSVSFRSRFRHYVNLDKTEERFNKLLRDFAFSSIGETIGFSNSENQFITHNS
jgi:hypothetical protein